MVLRELFRRTCTLLAISAMFAAASPAAAQDEPAEPPPADEPGTSDPARTRARDPLRADALFDEAIALGDRGQWDLACPKFRESLAADASVGTLLNVASCSLREGNRLQAAREYRRILEMNATTTDPDRKRSVAATAQAALDKLVAELASVGFQVLPARPGVTIVIDGRRAEPLAPGKVTELEPGRHRIEVTAPGFRRLERNVVLSAGNNDTLVFSLEPERAPTPPPAAAAGPRALSTAGWVTGLLGGALAASGGALLVVAADHAAEIRAECGPDARPPSCPLGSAEVADELGTEGRAFAVGGYVGLGVGGAAVATGIGLLVADAVSTDAVVVVPRAGTSEAGVWLVTRF
ncbi:MAG: PEGA domain-containing protein [Myxococcales bacterium]|nr:PEGA domain-containing protein [Myxococcales bacterium]